MKKEEKIRTIEQIICEYYEVLEKDMRSKTRKSEVVLVRHMITYMARYELGITFREIGEFLNKEVSTVIRNFQTISNSVHHDKILQKDVQELKTLIREKIENRSA